MPKKLPDIRTEAAALLKHYRLLQPQLLKERIIVTNAQGVLATLVGLIEIACVSVDSVEYPEALQHIRQFFSDHWEKVQGNYLSYTAQSHSKLTELLCDVAVFIAHAVAPDAPNALAILMPGLNFDNMHDDYPSLESVADTAKLLTILKTHILGIGENGLPDCLIPISALCGALHRDDEAAGIIDIRFDDKMLNPYAERFLKSSELQRLQQHTEQTRHLWACYERYVALKGDRGHLLGQLELLAGQLYLNSKHGIGTEAIAGAGGERAIRNFFDFYNQLQDVGHALTDALKLQIMKLRHCIGVYGVNEPKIPLIETCFATRCSELRRVMAGQETVLASIGITQTTQTSLFVEAEKVLRTALKNISTHTAVTFGCDGLPLTLPLLNTLGIPLTFTSFDEFMEIFAELSPQEIANFISDAAIVNTIIQAIDSFENWLMLVQSTSVERLTALHVPLVMQLLAVRFKDFLSPSRIQSIRQALSGMLPSEKHHYFDDLLKAIRRLQFRNFNELLDFFITTSSSISIEALIGSEGAAKDFMIETIASSDNWVRLLEQSSVECLAAFHTEPVIRALAAYFSHHNSFSWPKCIELFVKLCDRPSDVRRQLIRQVLKYVILNTKELLKDADLDILLGIIARDEIAFLAADPDIAMSMLEKIDSFQKWLALIAPLTDSIFESFHTDQMILALSSRFDDWFNFPKDWLTLPGIPGKKREFVFRILRSKILKTQDRVFFAAAVEKYIRTLHELNCILSILEPAEAVVALQQLEPKLDGMLANCSSKEILLAAAKSPLMQQRVRPFIWSMMRENPQKFIKTVQDFREIQRALESDAQSALLSHMGEDNLARIFSFQALCDILPDTRDGTERLILELMGQKLHAHPNCYRDVIVKLNELRIYQLDTLCASSVFSEKFLYSALEYMETRVFAIFCKQWAHPLQQEFYKENNLIFLKSIIKSLSQPHCASAYEKVISLLLGLTDKRSIEELFTQSGISQLKYHMDKKNIEYIFLQALKECSIIGAFVQVEKVHQPASVGQAAVFPQCQALSPQQKYEKQHAEIQPLFVAHPENRASYFKHYLLLHPGCPVSDYLQSLFDTVFNVIAGDKVEKAWAILSHLMMIYLRCSEAGKNIVATHEQHQPRLAQDIKEALQDESSGLRQLFFTFSNDAGENQLLGLFSKNPWRELLQKALDITDRFFPNAPADSVQQTERVRRI